MRLVVVSNRLPFTVSFKDGAPQFKPSAGGLTTGLWSYLNRKTPDGDGAPGFFMDGLAGRERSARTRGGGAGLCRAAVQVQPGLFAGREHGPVLSRLLQQDPLAAVPLFPDADALRGGELAGIPARQPGLRRGGGQRAAAGRCSLDSRLSPDAAAETGARKVSGNAHRFFPAHPVSVLGNFPDAAARRGARKSSTGCSAPA